MCAGLRAGPRVRWGDVHRLHVRPRRPQAQVRCSVLNRESAVKGCAAGNTGNASKCLKRFLCVTAASRGALREDGHNRTIEFPLRAHARTHTHTHNPLSSLRIKRDIYSLLWLTASCRCVVLRRPKKATFRLRLKRRVLAVAPRHKEIKRSGYARKMYPSLANFSDNSVISEEDPLRDWF